MLIPLHVRSHYSIGHGAASIEALVARAAALGLPALALTDVESLAGQPCFHDLCQRAGRGCEPLPNDANMQRLACPARRRGMRKRFHEAGDSMINGYVTEGGRLRAVDDLLPRAQSLAWIDLQSPTHEEESLLERMLGVDIPTLEDMEEIELSSRLYRSNHALYMTATLPAQSDRDDPEMAPVTFMLAEGRLVTVRYHDPSAFGTFVRHATKTPAAGSSGRSVLIGLLEVIVDRLADVVERAAGEIDAISASIFGRGEGRRARTRDFRQALEEIGRKGDLTSKLRESLATLDRLAAFLAQVIENGTVDADVEERARLATLARDVHSLIDHLEFLTQNIAFLLNATLGMINIEQNGIIKIFSVAAVVFLPPTLIASIYGMNFDRMPELDWASGYPFALALMAVSAIVPLWLFKRRGWL